MTKRLRADLVPLDAERWRLVGADGRYCTLNRPPRAWVAGLQGRVADLDDDLTDDLTRRGWIVDDERPGTVVVVGGGTTAAEVVLCLAQSGVAVQISAPESALAVLDPLNVHASAASAVRSWVVTRLPGAHLAPAPHWTGLTYGSADLVVVATETVQPDRAITDHLSRQLLPYLVVRAHHDLATAGPFVNHVDGPCLACLDLATADHDPDWLATLAGLTKTAARPRASVARWAATQAALEAEWYLRCAATTLSGCTVEMTTSAPGLVRRRWQQHADCACGCAAPLFAPVTALRMVA